MKHFNELTLPASLQQALQAMKFETPTPIQAQAIPIILDRKDVIGCAQTGTGKTAAFSVPMVARLLEEPQKIGLILAPTRELAVQIQDVLIQLTARMPQFKTALLIGGASMHFQVRSLRARPRIIVATPGRLMDHLRQRTVSLQPTEFLVLDEADRMLDMGFAPQLNEILKHLPQQRQTLLFSATLPSDILKLAMKYLRDPVRVTIGAVSTPVEKIKQEVINTTGPKKNEALIDQLNASQGSVLIFARTKIRTNRVTRTLLDYGFNVSCIHGDRSQNQRQQAIDGFRSGRYKILVATDIAARGIDIPHIAHVINYDLPQCSDDYIHRIGRTARAGAEGRALSILTPEDRSMWREITRLLDRTGKGSMATVITGGGSTAKPQHQARTRPAAAPLVKANAVGTAPEAVSMETDGELEQPRRPHPRQRFGVRGGNRGFVEGRRARRDDNGASFSAPGERREWSRRDIAPASGERREWPRRGGAEGAGSTASERKPWARRDAAAPAPRRGGSDRPSFR